MQKSDVVKKILAGKKSSVSKLSQGVGYAPTNIALCKYWGKRNSELNLPVTPSLSVALLEKGAKTILTVSESEKDVVILNGKILNSDTGFVQRLCHYLDLFREQAAWKLHIDINMNIPVAAGLASSACGFAAISIALNDLFHWELSKQDLSILARLGSGSAARSLWNGFVEWHKGERDDGMDSYAEPYDVTWPALRVGIVSITHAEKSVSSRKAMQQTVENSVLYESWPKKVAEDLAKIKQALRTNDFTLLGSTAESNALAMHATMLASWPPVCYFLPETIATMHKIWELRQQGIAVYFTEDAGPNVKLLFLEKDVAQIKQVFPEVEVVSV